MHVEKYIRKFKPRVDGDDIWITVEKKDLMKVLRHLRSIGVLRISSITGNDLGDRIEVIYHLIHKQKTINVKVSLDGGKPSVESVTKIYPGANLFERELYEMLGVAVKGHPNLKRLFLDKNSPETPLRKSPDT